MCYSSGTSFPSLADWFLAFARLRNNFLGGSGPFPNDIITRAERSFDELNQSTSREACMVFHGALHHANILLSSKEEWLAIDPKGIVRAPGYEVGPFMLNRLQSGGSDAGRADPFNQRLAIFSDELPIDKTRLGW